MVITWETARIYYVLVGERVGQGPLYLYELVGECVYLYVGQGRDGRGINGRTNDDRGKDVVPVRLLLPWLKRLLFVFPLNVRILGSSPKNNTSFVLEYF